MPNPKVFDLGKNLNQYLRKPMLTCTKCRASTSATLRGMCLPCAAKNEDARPTLRKNETIDLRTIFSIALSEAVRQERPDRAADIQDLWDKTRKAFQCEHDTDNDGNCHLCIRDRGGCELTKPLR